MSDPRTPISFVATSRADAALAFYRDAMGLTLTEQSPYALVFDDCSRMLRVQIVTDHIPQPQTVHGWQVDDIEREIADLTSKGVEFSLFDGMAQTLSGVWITPNADKIAWFKDPDGNILSLTQFARA